MSRVRVRGWWLLPMLVAVMYVVPWPVWVIEHGYARTVYPRIQRVVTSASNQAPFAVIDAGLVVLAVFLLTLLVRLIRGGRDRGWISAVWEMARRVVRGAAALALVFLVFWGLNYRRQALEDTLSPGSPVAQTSEAVTELARAAAAGANRLRPAAQSQPDAYSAIAARLEPAFQHAMQRLGLTPLSVAGRPKVSRVLTPFFTAAGVNGMVNPLVLESIVHPDLLPFERPMVLAHEWAHLAGFADEADASAVAWAACVTGDAGLAYSAHMFVMLETASQVPSAVWREIRAGLEPGVVEDLAALARRLTRQQPVVRDNAFRVYDHYLKSNQVDDGVRSYGRVVRVLLTPAMRQILSSSSISSAVIGRDDNPVRRSSGAASGPSVRGR